MGRLFQELIIFGRITIDNSRLMWQLTHQQEMRAEKFCSLSIVGGSEGGVEGMEIY